MRSHNVVALDVLACCERLFCLEEIEVIRVAARGPRLADRLRYADCLPLLDRNKGDPWVAPTRPNVAASCLLLAAICATARDALRDTPDALTSTNRPFFFF